MVDDHGQEMFARWRRRADPDGPLVRDVKPLGDSTSMSAAESDTA